MDLIRIVRSMRTVVQGAFPSLHGHLVKALGDAAVAMLITGHCQLSQLALVGPGLATGPSRQRRWQRLVANAHLDVHSALDAWAPAFCAGSARSP